MKSQIIKPGIIALLMLVTPVFAADHEHSDHQKSQATMPHDGQVDSAMFLKTQNIDGYDVTFHVMKAQPGKEMGGSHDFMVKVEKNGKVVPGLIMNTKVVYPNGESETKMAMKMGDWLMAGYDLSEEGKYQLMILFKTAGGKKYKGGIYYP